MNITRSLIASCALSSISVAACAAENPAEPAVTPGDQAAAASTANPVQGVDREWVTVTGNITDVTPQGFKIDYGAGAILVEMDGLLADPARQLRADDWVTVSGRIDDSFWERRSIEASSVYSSRLQERFWASAVDEEGDTLGLALIDVPDQGDWLGVTGEVVSVDQVEKEMVLDLGSMNLQVDTTGLAGPVLADRGDRVSVYGSFDNADLWDAKEIDATSVVIFNQGPT